MGLQEQWSSGPSACLFLQMSSPPPEFPFSVTTIVVWGQLNAPPPETATPFQSMVSPVVRSAGPVAHLGAWCCSYLAEDIAFSNSPLPRNDKTANPINSVILLIWLSQGQKMADLEAVLADVSYLMAMEKSKSTPAARASKKIILPEPR